MKHKFNKLLSKGVIFKTTKIQLPVSQIDFQNTTIFNRGSTLSDLKWGQTPTTTLDIKTFKLKWQHKDNHEKTHTLNEHT